MLYTQSKLLTVFQRKAFKCLLFCLSMQPILADAFDKSDVVLDGEFKQGGLIIGQTLPGTSVWFNDQPILITRGGEFVFGFGRDAPLSHKLELAFGSKRIMLPIAIDKREYRIQRVDGVPQRTVDPPAPEVLKRIRAETALVKNARKRKELLGFFKETFEWPVVGRISGVYGSQRYYNGEPRRPHYGIDIAAPAGTKVLAPNSGIVTLVHADMYYSGGTLIVDHGYGVSSTFLHLKSSLVKEGDRVKKGQPIALVGSSGRSTGPHLDWRINWFGTRIDPQLVANQMKLK